MDSETDSSVENSVEGSGMNSRMDLMKSQTVVWIHEISTSSNFTLCF